MKLTEAIRITNTGNKIKLKRSTEILGKKVEEITGSSILALDMRGSTGQQKLDQFVFAADVSKINGDKGIINTKKFYCNAFFGSSSRFSGFGSPMSSNFETTIDLLNGESINVNFHLMISTGRNTEGQKGYNYINSTLNDYDQQGGADLDGNRWVQGYFINYYQISPSFQRNAKSSITVKNHKLYNKLSKRFQRFNK